MNALFEQLLTLRRMEYVTLDEHLQLVAVSSGGQPFADGEIELVMGVDCGLPFPELIGSETDLMAVLQGDRASFELHAIARVLPDGTLLYFDLCVAKVTEADFADASVLIMFFEDVTQTMTLEQRLVQASNEMSLLLNALTNSKEYLDKIVTAIADALIVTNQTGIIKTVNQATQTMLGYSQAELIGQSIAHIVADQNFLLQAIQPTPTQEEACEAIEIVCRTSSNARRLVAFSCSSIQEKGAEFKDFIYLGRDITDRERNQQRLMAQYTIARLLSEATTIAQATTKILPTLCQLLEWDLVELWLAEDTHENDATSPLKVQRCVEAWSKSSLSLQEFVAIAQKTTLAAGIGLSGRVWATKQPQWVTVDNLDARQSSLATRAGLKAACGFPVQSSGEVLGVITFFSRELKEPAQDLLQTMTVIGSQLGQFIQRKRTETALHTQQEQTERLLLNVLPKPIAERLKQSPDTIAEHFANATVLFADLVNFTHIASSLSPIELVNLLNQIFSTFDRLSEHYNLEKIKTIGDSYMVVGGIPKQRDDHAHAIAAMALDMQRELAHLNTHLNDHWNATNGDALTMRIGIHSGPVIAGVIGIKKFIYDLWGDTVNIASRMESQGVPGQIQVTATTYAQLQDQYLFKYRGCIPIKGKGQMDTYFLVGKHAPDLSSSTL